MHYAFDAWLAREHPTVRFERYADDAVIHCVSRGQAERLVTAIGDRMAEVGLQLHPTKTRIVYCKDGNRRLDAEHTAFIFLGFTFLGFTFRARGARSRAGVNFTCYLPAVSDDALKRMSRQVRRWRLHRRIGSTLPGLAERINPIVRGWVQYYGAFYPTALHPLLRRINSYLMRFLQKKYRRLRSFPKALACWRRIVDQNPRLFAHWKQTAASW
jgi:retron-type reverse transcriptase